MAEYAPEPRGEEWSDPCRLSDDLFVRWCVSCNTVLTANGQSAFCVEHRTEYSSLVRKRKRWERSGVVDVDRRVIIKLLAEKDNLERSLGRLTRVYNTEPDNLAQHMDQTMQASKKLLGHIAKHFENPESPSKPVH